MMDNWIWQDKELRRARTNLSARTGEGSFGSAFATSVTSDSTTRPSNLQPVSASQIAKVAVKKSANARVVAYGQARATGGKMGHLLLGR